MTTIDLKDIVSARDLPRRPAGLGDAIVGVPSSPGQPMFLAGVDEIPPSAAVQAQIDALAAGQGNAMVPYATAASLPAADPGEGKRLAWVYDDPVPENNGAWAWDGSEWVRSADLTSALSGKVDVAYPAALALMETKEQQLGLTIPPIMANTAGANTRIITRPADQDSFVESVTFFAAATGTVKIGVYSVSGTTYTRVSSATVTVGTTGVVTLTPSDFGSIAVAAGQVVGIGATSGVLTYRNAVTGFGVATIPYDAASGTAATSTDNIWQIGAVLSYNSQVATGAAVKALQEGRGGVVTAGFAGVHDVTDAQRVFVFNLPTGADLAYKADGIWRNPRGDVLSSALGRCAVPGVVHYFSARDVEGDNGIGRRWPSQDGAITLTARGATPAIDRRGFLTTTGRAPDLLAQGSGTATLGSAGHKLVRMHDVPDSALASPPSGGFTCTGMTRDGAGYWIFGQFGQATFVSPFTPSIVIVSPSLHRVVAELPLTTADFPGINGIQGVAWDSSDDTIWFVDTANKFLRHISRTGTKLVDEIDMASVGEPNGIAYDATRDALWVSITGSNICRLVSCATGSVIATCPIQGTTDHMHWDAGNEYLYCTYGANGSNGNVEVRDTKTGAAVASYLGLNGSQSIEGIWADGAGKMFVANDGGYHIEASPALNVVSEYDVTVPPPAAHSRVLTFGVVIRQTGTPGSSQAIVAEGDPTRADVGGWALFLSGANSLRFMARDLSSSAVAQVDWTVPGLAGDAFRRAVVKVDLDAGTAALHVDGVVIAGTVTAPLSNVTQGFAIGARLAVANAWGQRTLSTADVSSFALGGNVSVVDLNAYLLADTRGLP